MPFSGFLLTIESMREYPSAGFSASEEEGAHPEDAAPMTAKDVADLAEFGG